MKQMIRRSKNRPLLLAAAFLTAMAVSLLQAVPAFADDGDAGENVTVAITAGEHGSVNGHTGSFSETVESGTDLTLSMQADDGYVIETVVINETELEAEDLEDFAAKKSGEMTLEEVTEDMTVEVSFTEDETGGEDPEGPGDSEPGTEGSDGDGTDPAGETGTRDPEEPSGAGTEDTGVDPENGEGTDPEDLQPGDSGAEGSDAQGDEDGSAADDETAGNQKDEKASQSDGKGSAREGKDGEGSAAPDKGSSDTYDSTPKTGDSLPMKAIALLIASLGTLCAFAADRILRKRIFLKD